MKINARIIAQLINGKVEGDENVEVSAFGKIEEAQQGQLAFLANPSRRRTDHRVACAKLGAVLDACHISLSKNP